MSVKGHYMNNLKSKLFSNSFYYLYFNKILYIFSFVLAAYVLISISVDSFAMKPSCYSYDKLKKALPEKYQKSEFIYESDGVAKLAFGTYKKSGIDYRTSMKHSGDTLYYCVNYNNHFTDDKSFIINNSMYSDELRARIGLAMHLGTTTWNVKANKGYTTGHFITDYFMTQLVIHGLIYKYGGKYSDQGVDFDSVGFKSGTGDLSKKTKSLYEACCNADFKAQRGNFQNAIFSFENPSSQYLFFDEAQRAYVSKKLQCITDDNNGTVPLFNRESVLYNPSGIGIANHIIVNDDITYDSPYSFNIPIEILNEYDPGLYTAKVYQSNTFNRIIANMWTCSDKNYTNNQEVMGLSTEETAVEDSITVKLFIGETYIKKTDSVSGDNIPDAEFQLYQFDNTSNEYKFYRNFSYDEKSEKYYSGKIFINENNPDRKFKVIESKPGKNYINDWPGREFVFTDSTPVIELSVENKPILGELHIRKSGEDYEFIEFNNSKDINSAKSIIFNKKDSDGKDISHVIKMPKVKFELYADSDIFNRNILVYHKDQKIADLITNDSGNIDIFDLLPGKYYFKECETNKLYVLDEEVKHFEITYNNHQYSTFTYNMDNYLKKCKIKIYKYTSDLRADNNDMTNNTGDKIPLSDCVFGLYTKNNIYNPAGELKIKKDTLISKGITDEKGFVEFTDLLYTDYYIKELSVPDGIILKEDILNVDTSMFELIANTTDQYSASIHIFNKKQEYKIKLVKYGQQFIKTEKDNDTNGTYSKYILEYGPLKNVSYSLYDNNNKYIDKQTTDDNGIINFSSLEYGDYICIEDAAPGQYEINTEPILISCKELKSDNNTDENGAIVVSKDLNNNLCTCNLNILKMGESAEVKDGSLQYTSIPLEGIVFGIYQNFDFKFNSGEILPANTCLGYITTDNNGRGNYNGVLPEGSYYLKELKTLSDYDIDKEIHTFEIKSNNNKSINIDLSNEPFINYLSKSSVKIIKTDSNTGKKLKGVEFTLFNSKDEIIGIYKTNRKGEIFVDKLPYGNYYFVETKCINGYYSTNNKYSFTLDDSETRVLEITNTPILKLGFEENYKKYLCTLMIIMGIVFITLFYSLSNKSK